MRVLLLFVVQMEREPFAHGAMRECFRMKKMSQVNPDLFFNMNWDHCNNYVAKRYLKAETERGSYFADIKMQMVGDEEMFTPPPRHPRHSPISVCLLYTCTYIFLFTQRPRHTEAHSQHRGYIAPRREMAAAHCRSRRAETEFDPVYVSSLRVCPSP